MFLLIVNFANICYHKSSYLCATKSILDYMSYEKHIEKKFAKKKLNGLKHKSSPKYFENIGGIIFYCKLYFFL